MFECIYLKNSLKLYFESSLLTSFVMLSQPLNLSFSGSVYEDVLALSVHILDSNINFRLHINIIGDLLLQNKSENHHAAKYCSFEYVFENQNITP